jgi:exopolyphosphatase / guanosine-5'-triphosphate,3'-diphosphate pyrophosphatase
MRVDVLDLGSSTFHLLAAEVDGRGELRAVRDEKETVHLGERAFAEARIPAEAFRRGIAAVGRLLGRLKGDAAETLVVVATGIFREAVNAHAFLDELSNRYGLRAAILSGEAEARFTFHGARSALPDPGARLALFDLGGGSLECVLGEGQRVEIARSLPLGALRLKSRYLGSHPSEAETLRVLREVVRDGAETTVRAIRKGEPDEVVLSSGTARALLRVARKLELVDESGSWLERQTLFQLSMILASLDCEALTELGVSEARAETLGAGSVILATLVEMMGAARVRVSPRALREGVALQVAAGQEGRWSESGERRV